jgi:hypothetical protein
MLAKVCSAAIVAPIELISPISSPLFLVVSHLSWPNANMVNGFEYPLLTRSLLGGPGGSIKLMGVGD